MIYISINIQECMGDETRLRQEMRGSSNVGLIHITCCLKRMIDIALKRLNLKAFLKGIIESRQIFIAHAALEHILKRKV